MTLQNKILQELQDPDNRKIVNEGQDIFEVYESRDSFFDGEYPNATLFIFTELFAYETGYEALGRFPFQYALDNDAVNLCIIRHCINLLPCFNEPTEKYKQLKADIEYVGKIMAKYRGSPYGMPPDGRPEMRRKLKKLVPSIRQALLRSGALTLDELETYYKELI